jgi:hypothetical protein
MTTHPSEPNYLARRYPTLYIAGPMTGHPQFNYPAFHEAAERLTASGYKVLNPAGNKRDREEPWAWFMRDAITMMLQADAIATLIGWQYSRGARIEVELAKSLTIPARTIEQWISDANVAKMKSLS